MSTTALALLAAPVLVASQPIPAKGSMQELARFMVGSFSSAAQAAEDPQNFKDIRLEVVRIWADRSDGPWLYVEQAAAESLAKPYRQRVYRLSMLPGGRFRSDIYTLKGDPLKHAGAGRHSAPLSGLTPEDLEMRSGCAVILAADGNGTYRGSTQARDCESSLRGAVYATSDVQVDALGMVSWDRGFDAAGRQVWGSIAGGYRFRRAESPGRR